MNIADYGGNPDAVTLLGNSAGSMAVSILLTVPPLLAPSFQRAVLQSGTLLSPTDMLYLNTNWTHFNLQFR